MVEWTIQIVTKSAKFRRFLKVNVTTTNNSAEGAEAGGNNKAGKEVMEDKIEKEKKPWKCLEGSNGFFKIKKWLKIGRDHLQSEENLL